MQIDEFMNIVKAEGMTNEEAEIMWECRPSAVNLDEGPENAKLLRIIIAEKVKNSMPALIELREMRKKMMGEFNVN